MLLATFLIHIYVFFIHSCMVPFIIFISTDLACDVRYKRRHGDGQIPNTKRTSRRRTSARANAKKTTATRRDQAERIPEDNQLLRFIRRPIIFVPLSVKIYIYIYIYYIERDIQERDRTDTKTCYWLRFGLKVQFN